MNISTLPTKKTVPPISGRACTAEEAARHGFNSNGRPVYRVQAEIDGKILTACGYDRTDALNNLLQLSNG